MPNNKTSDVMVQIKGDQKDLDKALRSSKSSLKNFSSSAVSTGAALAKMAAIGAVAIAGLTYASWNLTKGFKDYGIQLDKISKSTGVNAEATSQMAYAAEQEHASLEDLQTGWRKLSKTMGDADEGLAESLRSFDALGLSIHDNTGQLKTLDSMTLEIADALKNMANDTQKAALAQDLFGRSGMNLIPFFELGSEGINLLMKESKDLGNVWTNEMAAGAKLFDDKLTALNYSFKAVKWQIGNALMPEFEKITDWFMTNKDWLIQTFKDIFKFDVENFGETITNELDEIKKWTETNKDTLSDTWSGFITATDVANTGVKILLTSVATVIAAQRYVLAGFKKEDLETLRDVSAKTLDVHIAAGEKPWMQNLVASLGELDVPREVSTRGTPQANIFQPGPSFRGDVSRALTILKLDSNATNALLTGKAISVTSQAATSGT
jgi:hypothetical protein